MDHSLREIERCKNMRYQCESIQKHSKCKDVPKLVGPVLELVGLHLDFYYFVKSFINLPWGWNWNLPSGSVLHLRPSPPDCPRILGGRRSAAEERGLVRSSNNKLGLHAHGTGADAAQVTPLSCKSVRKRCVPCSTLAGGASSHSWNSVLSTPY
jgi:hypothetical protein